MEINYTITKDDLYLFWKKILQRDNTFFKKEVYLYAICIVFIWSLWYPWGFTKTDETGKQTVYEGDFLSDFLINSIIALIIIFIIRYINLNKKKIEQHILEYPNSIGDRKLEIIDDKIIVYSNKIKTEYLISNFDKTIEDDNFHYLIPKKDKSLLLYIPKRDLEIKSIQELKIKIQQNVS